jgi:hypothetical protein
MCRSARLCDLAQSWTPDELAALNRQTDRGERIAWHGGTIQIPSWGTPMHLPNEQLLVVMREAYGCRHFGSCRQAKFDPRSGNVPRGFLGATGDLRDVEAIFVIAEPGHPHPDERYSDQALPYQLLSEAVSHAHRSYRDGTDLFHRNMRWVMDQLWPGSFDEKLGRVWITEGRLCSIDIEIGGFNDKLCAPTYLSRQIALMPSAAIVLFGAKARQRVSALSGLEGRVVVEARALAPPGANHKGSKPSWQNAIDVIRSRRAQMDR